MSLLLGVVASLGGVIVGAFLTRWIDAGYERRREVRTAVASALTLQEELRDAEEGIKVMIEDKEATTAFLFPGLAGAWENHREVLLAVGMPHRDWIFLAHTFRGALELTTHLKDPAGVEFDDENVEFLEVFCKECAEGRARLRPFIVEAAKVPLTQPTQIFRVDGCRAPWWSFAPLGVLGRLRKI